MDQEKINSRLKELRSELLQMILEESKEDLKPSDMESMEAQKAKIEQQFEAAYSEYLEHLKHGYEAIISEIASQIKK